MLKVVRVDDVGTLYKDKTCKLMRLTVKHLRCLPSSLPAHCTSFLRCYTSLNMTGFHRGQPWISGLLVWFAYNPAEPRFIETSFLVQR